VVLLFSFYVLSFSAFFSYTLSLAPSYLASVVDTH